LGAPGVSDMLTATLKTQGLVEQIRDIQEIRAGLIPTLSAGMRATIGVMVGHVVKNKLRGQVLNRRTGTLIRSVTASQEIRESDRGVRGSFGTNLDYGIRHEEGYTGPINVPARKVRAHVVREHVRNYRGRAVTVREHTVAQHIVRAHTAQVVVAARHYLRDGFREKLDEGLERFKRALRILVDTGKPPTQAELRGKI